MLRFDILTIHPGMLVGPLEGSILGRGVANGLIDIHITNIRDFATDRHRNVDDAPYGGGPGMVMKADVISRALKSVRTENSFVILTSAAGRPFLQKDARAFSTQSHIVIICGHYEGVDARVESLVDAEISIGDFVLTGGEIPALAIVDSVARLVPGVLGNEASSQEESFSEGLLEYSQYTRPLLWNDLEVPEVLLSGHHKNIATWRMESAKKRTKERRPDLWARYIGQDSEAKEEGSKENVSKHMHKDIDDST